MRFTSLIVELIRARPRLLVWVAILFQAAIWLVVALLLYRAPPGDLATVLAYGREYQVGTDLGPPLAFWLADIAFRAAGNHLIGVYILSLACLAVTFNALFSLARAIVGGQHAVLAVLLTMTIAAFDPSGVVFGPLVLARPLWALILLHGWQIIGQNRRRAWFALSIEAGLLLLTTSAALPLLLLLLIFALATRRGRQTLWSFDPLLAVAVIVALALPYLIWLAHLGAPAWPQWPTLAQWRADGIRLGPIAGWLVASLAGIGLLLLLDRGRLERDGEEPPTVFRPPVTILERDFVYVFALAPPIGGSLLAAVLGLDQPVGGDDIVLLLSGLAVIVALGDVIHIRHEQILRNAWALLVAAPAIIVVVSTLVLPWLIVTEVPTALPARSIAAFFGESFARRTGHPLAAVAGDPQLAALVALGPARPHLFLDATPQSTPWVTFASFHEHGGVVVWRAADRSGAVPPDIAQRFPGLTPELPHPFDRIVNGQKPRLLIGWAIVRPAQAK